MLIPAVPEISSDKRIVTHENMSNTDVSGLWVGYPMVMLILSVGVSSVIRNKLASLEATHFLWRPT